MNRDELIEAIIKEVKRVLAERGIPTDQPSGAISTASRVEPSIPAPAPAPPATATDFMVGSRDLTGKQILTQKDLEAFQGTTIRVMRRAVITPLALDYAREKGITIQKVDRVQAPAENSGSSAAEVSVALAIASNFNGDKNVVTSILAGKGFGVRDYSETGYEAAVKKLTAVVASGSARFGVLIENSGMEGPIYGNRNDGIRAVHCRTTMDARAARVDYDANVIVIDSTSDPNAVISGFC